MLFDLFVMFIFIWSSGIVLSVRVIDDKTTKNMEMNAIAFKNKYFYKKNANYLNYFEKKYKSLPKKCLKNYRIFLILSQIT